MNGILRGGTWFGQRICFGEDGLSRSVDGVPTLWSLIYHKNNLTHLIMSLCHYGGSMVYCAVSIHARHYCRANPRTSIAAAEHTFSTQLREPS